MMVTSVPASGTPLPAGASVLKALGASLHGMRPVMLKEAEKAETVVFEPPSGEAAGRSSRAAGERLEIQAEIARGGMGAVFKGRDVDLGREVAVKVLLETHQGKTELLQRFVEEAQIHGQLQHPGVAPVYELGQFQDQSPYFTMKLVQGETLARLLAQRKDPSEERSRFLAIFEQVCQTLAYAHARGVIHRDLKPANIMVGAFGEVQVMDWGLGKVLAETGSAISSASSSPAEVIRTSRSGRSPDSSLLDSQTQAGSILGTLAYMPPEQALGDIDRMDARADVFALGAILCEILTGFPPYTAKDRTELWRQASECDLADALARLDGSGTDDELSELARSALALKPEDRPADAGALASRLIVYRDGVEKRLRQAELAGAEAKTRAVEERRRRKLWLAFSSAVVVVLLMGIVGTTWGLILASAAKETAQRRLVQVERGNELLGSIFQDLNPREEQIKGQPLRVLLGDRLDRVSAEMAGDSVGDPQVIAKLQQILGLSQLGLGHSDKAITLFTRARATFTSELGAEHRDTVTSTNNLALAYQEAGQVKLAIPLFEEALHKLQIILGPQHADTAMTMNNLALAYLADGKLAMAIPLLEDSLKLHRADPGPKAKSTLNLMNNLAMAYRSDGKPDRALPLLIETLELRKVVLGPDHFDTAYSSNNLALAYQDAGDLDQAIPLFEAALAQFTANVGRKSPATSTCMNNLALAYLADGELAKAIPLLEESLKLHRAEPGANHPSTLNVMNNLGMAYRDDHQLNRALPLLKETLTLRKTVLDLGHFDTAVSTNNLAMAYQDAGELDLAIELFGDSFQRFKASLKAEHPFTIQCLTNLVTACFAARRYVDAIPSAEELIAIQRRVLPPDDPALARSMSMLGMSLLEMKRPMEAESVLRDCLAIREKKEPDAWTTFNTKSLLGGALLGQKKYADAEPSLLAGYEGMKQRDAKIPEPAKVRLPEAIDRLIELSAVTNKPDHVRKWQAERAKYP